MVSTDANMNRWRSTLNWSATEPAVGVGGGQMNESDVGPRDPASYVPEGAAPAIAPPNDRTPRGSRTVWLTSMLVVIVLVGVLTATARRPNSGDQTTSPTTTRLGSTTSRAPTSTPSVTAELPV